MTLPTAKKAITINTLNEPKLEQFNLADMGASQNAIASFQTGVLAAGAVYAGTIEIPKACEILSVSADYPAWIRVYGSNAALVADTARLITVDPTAGSGVYLDAATSGSATTINCAPVPNFNNNDSPRANVAYVSIKNIDSVSRNITFGLTYLPKES
jgi:hypothetical protein